MPPFPRLRASFPMSTDFFTQSPETTTTPMPVPLAEEGDTLSRLEKCIRQGDWIAVARLTAQFGSVPLPVATDELGEYISSLGRTLVAARIARAGLTVSLRRVRAAAGFTRSRAQQTRQEFAVTPGSCHP